MRAFPEGELLAHVGGKIVVEFTLADGALASYAGTVLNLVDKRAAAAQGPDEGTKAVTTRIALSGLEVLTIDWPTSAYVCGDDSATFSKVKFARVL
ncbi:hypothetical protein RN607_13540 [Demequina capsici]|uniref:Uncharacterized protein n=1 Tax=Demequina capsici TaxID=3075620 RepID=A0AA96JAP2_9MICO|nr:hypothetical protein [Demequina sp. PMTSA13]WNM27208.1 hypothetical protein RN607_13540 [Demequina sp. PMTSA13]